MQLSAKTEYACIAVLELARRHETGELARARDIAELHGIPVQFLVQILSQLKVAGLLSSTRGAAGGYQLACDPAEITLGQVMAMSEGSANELTSNASVSTPVSQALLSLWRQVAAKEQQMLDRVTFADLVAQTEGSEQKMYYI